MARASLAVVSSSWNLESRSDSQLVSCWRGSADNVCSYDGDGLRRHPTVDFEEKCSRRW